MELLILEKTERITTLLQEENGLIHELTDLLNLYMEIWND